MKNIIESTYKMKKTLFIIIIVAFLLSCSGEYDDVIYKITNGSKKNVNFTFNGKSEKISPGAAPITYTINSEKGIFSPENVTISTEHHPRSIKLTTINKGTSGIFYTFEDNEPLDLIVLNTLPINIKIFSYKVISNIIINNFISDDDNNFILTIEKNKEKTAKIYTSTPNFIILDETGNILTNITIDWNLINDKIIVIVKITS